MTGAVPNRELERKLEKLDGMEPMVELFGGNVGVDRGALDEEFASSEVLRAAVLEFVKRVLLCDEVEELDVTFDRQTPGVIIPYRHLQEDEHRSPGAPLVGPLSHSSL